MGSIQWLWIGGIHLLFTALVFFNSKKLRTPNLIALAWMLFLLFPLIRKYSMDILKPEILSYPLRVISYPYTYGPFLFLYTKSLTEWKFRIRSYHFLHFLPFVLFSIYYLAFEPSPHGPESLHNFESYPKPPPLVPLVHGILNLLSLVIYSFATIQLLRRYSIQIANFYSSLDSSRTLSGLRWIAIWFIGVYTFTVILTLFHNPNLGDSEIFTTIRKYSPILHGPLFVLEILMISFFAIRQNIFYSENDLKNFSEDSTQKNSERTIDKKYEKSGLNPKKSNQVEEKIFHYMIQNQAYLRDDLKISDVSKDLGISINYISQVLNENLGKNFYTFVNELRVREMQKRLVDPNFKEYSIMRIALECGFNSKSTFNMNFKKFVGISPQEFRKKQ